MPDAELDLTGIGRKIRKFRSAKGLTQADLAGRLKISPSYLNLIEHDRRRPGAAVLLKLSHVLDIDLRDLARGRGGQILGDVREVFSDPLFEGLELDGTALTDFASEHPEIATAVVRLHHAYEATRGSADALGERVLDAEDAPGGEPARLPSEQVSDLIQRHDNHFPGLEAEAESLWRRARLDSDNLFDTLARYLETTHAVTVKICRVGDMGGALRRFDPQRRELRLSEVLRRGSRHLQLAHQIGLLDCADELDRISADPNLTSLESRVLCRIALANYFAGAVLMPYGEFLDAAERERYDVDLLGHRFRVSFEQACHRLTTLSREGSEGVPFYLVRIDIGGNISKKLNSDKVRFPRFGGLCPLWNVHAAFLTPGSLRRQLSRLPDGATIFSIARTLRKHKGGFHAPQVLHGIELGCDVSHAERLVYADGMDLEKTAVARAVGVTCRLCDRMDCQARAFPPLQRGITIDENVRGASFYAPLAGR